MIVEDEAIYRLFVIALLFNLHGFFGVSSEREVGKGYCDIMLTSKRPGIPNIVMELKKGCSES